MKTTFFGVKYVRSENTKIEKIEHECLSQQTELKKSADIIQNQKIIFQTTWALKVKAFNCFVNPEKVITNLAWV